MIVDGDTRRVFDETGYELHQSEFPERVKVLSFKSKRAIEKEKADDQAKNSIPPFAL